jgi:hypothetical protein
MDPPFAAGMVPARVRAIASCGGTFIRQKLQLDPQDLRVPARLLGELVVGQDVGPALGLSEMGQLDDRDRLQAKHFGSLEPAMPGNDGALAIHQDRVGEAELADAVGDLADLLRAVGARVARIGPEAAWRDVGDGKGPGHRGLSSELETAL